MEDVAGQLVFVIPAKRAEALMGVVPGVVEADRQNRHLVIARRIGHEIVRWRCCVGSLAVFGSGTNSRIFCAIGIQPVGRESRCR